MYSFNKIINKLNISLINQNEDLQNFCNRIRNSEIIALDTEFTRDKTYYPKLCVLQISDGINIAVIDMLNNLDINCILEIIYDENKLKIIHSATHDLEVFYHAFGKIPRNIFDTQLASDFCGKGNGSGYSKLVQHFFNEEIDKSARYADWSIRPLTETQIIYAAKDVIYLPELYKILKHELSILNRLEWMNEDIKHYINPKNYDIPIDHYCSKIHHVNFSQEQKILLFSICNLREKTAQNNNIPRQSIISDHHITKIAIAKNANQYIDYLLDKNLLSNSLKHDLLDIVINNLNDFETHSPKLTQTIPSSNKELIISLKDLLHAKAQEYNLPERLITNIEQLKDFSRNLPCNFLNSSWRYEIFGKDAIKLRNKSSY